MPYLLLSRILPQDIAYIIYSVPNFMYPVTTFLFFIGFVYKYIVSVQSQEEKMTEEINHNFVQNLPKQRLMNELKMAKRVQQALLLVESPNIDNVLYG